MSLSRHGCWWWIAIKLLQVAGALPENIWETDGDAAAFLRARAPGDVNLILLDLQLPGQDGYAILQELCTNPALAGIPVVALTANVMRHDIERAQATGLDGFIGKPIDGRRFPDWLRCLLAGEQVWMAI